MAKYEQPLDPLPDQHDELVRFTEFEVIGQFSPIDPRARTFRYRDPDIDAIIHLDPGEA